MSDGKVIRYHIDIKQPAPVFKDKLDKFTKTCGAYPRNK